MSIFKRLSKIEHSNLVVLLVSLIFLLFIVTLLIIFVTSDRYIHDLDGVITESEAGSQKMRLYSEMMELARSRTRLTLQIIDTEDVFVQDELNQELEIYAGRFANSRMALLELPLLDEEREAIESLSELVPIILPAQRRAVDMAMNESDVEGARELVYQTVMPGQQRVIDLFADLTSRQQDYINTLAHSAKLSISDLAERSHWFFGFMMLLVAALAAVVIRRIQKIQQELKLAYEGLEVKVEERTSELQHRTTELEAANKALELLNKEQTSRFALILQTNPNGMLIVDEKGGIRNANRSAASIFGYEEGELLQLNVDELVPEHIREKHSGLRDGFKHSDPRGMADRDRIMGSRKDGSEVPLKISLGRIRQQGRDYVIATIEDISKRVTLEDNLRARTAEAEAANKAKSMFLANMSHELRTPMHAILSFTRLAMKKVSDEKQQKYLDNIISSGGRLTRLLNNLLDLAKLEANRMTIDFARKDLLKVVESSVMELESLANDKGVTISVNDRKSMEADFDEDRVTQVINNLLSNALKYSPVGGEINIDITLENMTLSHASGDMISLIVTDQGAGIPEEELDAVFDKFVQSSNTDKKAGGTGLGLAICREILHAHGGEIWAVSPANAYHHEDSETYPGTEFHFLLPVSQEKQKKE